MSTIDVLRMERASRQLDLLAAFERLDVVMGEAVPPADNPDLPLTAAHRRLRTAAANYADRMALFIASQDAVRNEIARRADRAKATA